MNKYEILYILTAALDEEQREAQIAKYTALVTENGGEVLGVNKWGMRKLAYPIDYKNEGYYVLMNFTAASDLPLEMERQMRISDSVMRFMIVRKD